MKKAKNPAPFKKREAPTTGKAARQQAAVQQAIVQQLGKLPGGGVPTT